MPARKIVLTVDGFFSQYATLPSVPDEGLKTFFSPARKPGGMIF